MGDEIKTEYSLIFEKVLMIKRRDKLEEWHRRKHLLECLWTCNPISLAYDYYFLLFYDG